MTAENNAPSQHRPRSCATPWTTLVLNHEGTLSFCCYLKGLGNLYEMSDNALEEIWNGPIARDVRARWVEGRLEGLRCANCPGLHRFGEYPHHAVTKSDLFRGSSPAACNARLNLSEYVAGATRLQSKPLEIIYIPSVACNIRCIHCFQPPAGTCSAIPREHLLRFYHQFGSRAIVHLMSGGEPLVIPTVQTLIEAMPAEHRAGSELVLQTNGQLLRDRLRCFDGFKKYHVRISIDGFDKQTYEYIHRGARFERLLEGIDALNQARSELNLSTSMVMILMRSNFHGLETLFDFADEHLFSDVWVTPVHAAFGKGNLLRHENIFEFSDLLDQMPEWPDILNRAIERSMLSGRPLACRHLEYIKDSLSRQRLERPGVVARSMARAASDPVPRPVATR